MLRAANTCLAQSYIADAKCCRGVRTTSPEAVQKAGYPGQGLNVQSDPSSTMIVRNGSAPCQVPPYCNCRRLPERSANSPVPFEARFTTTLDKPGKVVWTGNRAIEQFSGMTSSVTTSHAPPCLSRLSVVSAQESHLWKVSVLSANGQGMFLVP
jgi:hypothetical protein